MFKLLSLENYANILKHRYDEMKDICVKPDALSIYVGQLCHYASELNEDQKMFEQTRYHTFNSELFAKDLIKDNEVLQILGRENDVTDSDAVWLINPTDIIEGPVDMGGFEV